MTSVAALALPLLLASPALADANANSYGSWNEPAPGAPRAWQGGHGLNPYSTFNLLNGNTLTALGLVSIDPVGPPLTFALYHNSASANADESGAAGAAGTLATLCAPAGGNSG